MNILKIYFVNIYIFANTYCKYNFLCTIVRSSLHSVELQAIGTREYRGQYSREINSA